MSDIPEDVMEAAGRALEGLRIAFDNESGPRALREAIARAILADRMSRTVDIFNHGEISPETLAFLHEYTERAKSLDMPIIWEEVEFDHIRNPWE